MSYQERIDKAHEDGLIGIDDELISIQHELECRYGERAGHPNKEDCTCNPKIYAQRFDEHGRVRERIEIP